MEEKAIPGNYIFDDGELSMEEKAIRPVATICDRCRRLAMKSIQEAAMPALLQPWPGEEEHRDSIVFCSETCATLAFHILRKEFSRQMTGNHKREVARINSEVRPIFIPKA